MLLFLLFLLLLLLLFSVKDLCLEIGCFRDSDGLYSLLLPKY